ncbi:hypothetical protein E3N88_11688 [Mikania micrantha]|uniref:Uncharacterized protein n=1 Tax=Mikania micrantha TaxID=192012 RepID=A0A5N6P3J0_9ASTR|nr:hypothetical protein E3N88_11688 [Mikania micrantha]
MIIDPGLISDLSPGTFMCSSPVVAHRRPLFISDSSHAGTTFNWLGMAPSLILRWFGRRSSPLGTTARCYQDQGRRTMNLKHVLSRLAINKVSRFNGRRTPSWNYREICTCRYIQSANLSRSPNTPMAHWVFHRFIHSGQETLFSGAKGVETASDSLESEDDDAVMNEFLSRFVWIMRGKLSEVYTDAHRKEIDAMLQIIVAKVVSEMEEDFLEHFIDSESASMSQDFSEDLWATVREVSSVVLEDMKKAKKKEKMKGFLQSEEVKEMTRFAGEIGIRGDMLRELRFKWAREKLEDSEFYESLARMRKDSMEPDVESKIREASGNNTEGEDNDQVVSLPRRSGKIKYNIYGLDLSKPKWAEVAEQIHETGGSLWPQETKPITGECKIVTEKIISLQVDEDPSPLIAEWTELLQPSRVDWVQLLDRLKEQNDQMYFKPFAVVRGCIRCCLGQMCSGLIDRVQFGRYWGLISQDEIEMFVGCGSRLIGLLRNLDVVQTMDKTWRKWNQ